MGNRTGIAWTDHTFNPWRGCTKVAAGCANCYAETMSKRNPVVLGEWGPNGKRAMATEAYWRQPLAWDRAAARDGVRRKVLCASLADVFEDRPELRLARARLWHLITGTPNLDWLLLTKRIKQARAWCERWADLSGETDAFHNARGPEAVRAAHPSGRGQIFAEMMESMGAPPPGCAFPTFDWAEGPRWWGRTLPNVWLGVSVEDQATADARIPVLLDTPAAVRFVSYEPALGPWYPESTSGGRRPEFNCLYDDPRVDWIIVGGESGPKARPFDVAWARHVIGECRGARVPCFVKQLGARIESDGGREDWTKWPRGTRVDDGCDPRVLLRHRAGADPAEWPEDLRVRQFPEVWRG